MVRANSSLAAERTLKYPGVFVTGTGTGVGKTIVSAMLIRALRQHGLEATALKPFATGICNTSSWQDDDAKLLAAAAGVDPQSVRVLMFESPLAPHSAAELEGRTINPAEVLQLVRERLLQSSFTVVEGVGGAAVPIMDSYLVSDFARELALPVLIVARTDLGTINHTVLTIEHLRSHGCHILGVVFVRHRETNPDLAEITGPPLAAGIGQVVNFGVIPYCERLSSSGTASDALNCLPLGSPAVAEVIGSLRG